MSYSLFHPKDPRPLPLSLSRAEFAREFPTESEVLEFKTGTGGRPLQASSVAFSNHKGGVIVVGVDDDGDIRGRSLDPGTVDVLHQALAEAHDLGRYELHSLEVGGVGVTVVSIARRQEGFAQTSRGLVLVRRGSRDVALFGADLQRFLNTRSHSRFEDTTIGIPLEAANDQLMREVSAGFGWQTGSVRSDRLENAGLARDGELTVAGALTLLSESSGYLGKSFIEVLRFPDDETIDYDRRDELRGPAQTLIEQATTRVLDELGTDLVILGIRRFELPRLPPVVVREAVANAVAHRSYELSGTPVRVDLRPASVQIVSPGSFPEPVTEHNIREASAARNLNLIRVLRLLGLAEDAGRGVDVMQDTMQLEMLEQPTFRDLGHAVEVTLPIRSPVAPSERAWIRELEARGTLQGSDRIALVHAARGETLTNGRLRDLLHVDAARAREILQRLRDDGFLEQHGERGGAQYRLARSLRPPAGLRLDEDELADLVEQLAAQGAVTNGGVRQATGLDRVAALRILERLVAEGRLVRVGERRGARYVRSAAPE